MSTDFSVLEGEVLSGSSSDSRPEQWTSELKMSTKECTLDYGHKRGPDAYVLHTDHNLRVTSNGMTVDLPQEAIYRLVAFAKALGYC